MNRQQLLKQLFEAIDDMDAEKFSGFLAENASFKFGNAEPVIGRDNIRSSVAGFFSAIGGLSHDLSDIVENGDLLISRGEVTYARKDSSKLTLPFANFFKMEGDLVADYQIYVDVTPLFS